MGHPHGLLLSAGRYFFICSKCTALASNFFFLPARVKNTAEDSCDIHAIITNFCGKWFTLHWSCRNPCTPCILPVIQVVKAISRLLQLAGESIQQSPSEPWKEVKEEVPKAPSSKIITEDGCVKTGKEWAGIQPSTYVLSTGIWINCRLYAKVKSWFVPVKRSWSSVCYWVIFLHSLLAFCCLERRLVTALSCGTPPSPGGKVGCRYS